MQDILRTFSDLEATRQDVSGIGYQGSFGDTRVLTRLHCKQIPKKPKNILS